MLLLASCAEKKLVHEGTKIELYFCPVHDCEKALVDLIKASDKVDCAFYEVTSKSVLKAIKEKQQIRLVLDQLNNKGSSGDGANIRHKSGLMPSNICISDDRIGLAGSYTPTYNGNNRNNNNALVIYSDVLALNYKDEFEELWNLTFGNGEKVKNPVIDYGDTIIENYFCPEDNCEEHLISTIEKANKSIYFMTFSFTSENVADSLLKLYDVDIKGVFEARGAGGYSQYKRLKDFGLNVKTDNNKYTMHHKVFIIDESIVVTGSYNPTISGNTKNDENMLIIHNKNVADSYLREFGKVWVQ